MIVKKGAILTLSISTSIVKVAVMNEMGTVFDVVVKQIPTLYPHTGWIEQEPLKLWDTLYLAMKELFKKGNVNPLDISAIGITTEGLSVVAWDTKTQRPVGNILCAQDRRKYLKYEPLNDLLQKTGLVDSVSFSGPKMQYLIHECGQQGPNVVCTTLDAWILYQLTNHQSLWTESSHAAKTLLMDIDKVQYDDALCEAFSIPKSMLVPIKKEDKTPYGYTDIDLFTHPVPITAIATQESAATFAHNTYRPNHPILLIDDKSSFCLPLDTKRPIHDDQLITTIGLHNPPQRPYYLKEGFTFSVGLTFNWLQKSMGLIKSAKETEGLAYSIPNSGGMDCLPAPCGLGAPYWQDFVQTSMQHISPDTHIGHFTQSILWGLAHQLVDLCTETKYPILCGGKLCTNYALLQYTANLLQREIERPLEPDLASRGIGFLAGKHTQFYDEGLSIPIEIEQRFVPQQGVKEAQKMRDEWHKLCLSASS